jgi:hypothetical protein
MDLDSLSESKGGPEGLEQLAIVLYEWLSKGLVGFECSLRGFSTLIEVEGDLRERIGPEMVCADLMIDLDGWCCCGRMGVVKAKQKKAKQKKAKQNKTKAKQNKSKTKQKKAKQKKKQNKKKAKQENQSKSGAVQPSHPGFSISSEGQLTDNWISSVIGPPMYIFLGGSTTDPRLIG